jgi:hypothetical protein
MIIKSIKIRESQSITIVNETKKILNKTVNHTKNTSYLIKFQILTF